MCSRIKQPTVFLFQCVSYHNRAAGHASMTGSSGREHMARPLISIDLSMTECPDLSSILFTVCGKSRLKPNLTAEILQMINDNQVAPVENQLCSSVLISDRFALTAAHCWEKFADE